MANDAHSADDGLLPENFAKLNERFYAAQPWWYFQQRLAYLMLVAADTDRYRSIFADGVRLPPVEVKFEPTPAHVEDIPTVEQVFVAVEAEVLLHHTAETLLRFVHAHAEDDPCPWLRMSRLTRFDDFKEWTRSTIAVADEGDLHRLCVHTLACDPGEPTEIRVCGEYLRLLAYHFLDAGSYNAAKHGMALRGGAEQWTVTTDEWELLNRGGATVSWLARWPRRDPDRPARWTQVTRVLSVEATVALIQVTAQLMRALWLRGRERHLGDELDMVFRPVPPDQLFAAFDLRHPVIADFFRPLRYEGVAATLAVRSRHFEPPRDGEADDGLDDPD